MKSVVLREKFFRYFTQRGHMQVSSSPLIPADDPTLLFANAGMNQFKELFLGQAHRSYKRAVSIQKCIRAGGKHNDLENVGFTARHLTFFEMMGNFSFGDYFKRDAILFAWEFLTQEVGLPAAELWVSVFEQDDEAYQLWHELTGIPYNRIVKLGAQDNFWQMGDTGPCGPCTEIYIDRGSTRGCGSAACAPGCSCDRFLEIWNLVFMQLNRQQDGTQLPLAQTGVDTGMGLDRLTAVVQNCESVYETDLFAPIIGRIEQLTGISYERSTDAQRAAFRVLADHIRSSSLAIADGCVPGPDGRGYVLRKIIRRAALFARKLSEKSFFPQLVDGVIEVLGGFYPELAERRNFIVATLEQEVAQFSRNLIRGTQLLTDRLHDDTSSIVDGKIAFTLYDTYGFPLELTKVIAQEHNRTVDEEGFMKAMEHQRALSSKKQHGEALTFAIDSAIATDFTGYTELTTHATIRALTNEKGVALQSVAAGEPCWIITDRSPIYVECGGQISDEGTVQINGRDADIRDVRKQGSVIALSIIAPYACRIGDAVTLSVHAGARTATMKNHTATHLLQAALRNTLGADIKQAGSLVAPDYLRFDFSCNTTITADTIREVERIINQQILNNVPVSTRWTTLADAQRAGVIAFFGEKYDPAHVRVVEVPGISAELCGGTHVRATGDIGAFKIVEQSALSAGVRRIVAITGMKAIETFQETFAITKQLATQFKVAPEALVGTIEKLQQQLKEAHAATKAARKAWWRSQIPQWRTQTRPAGNARYGIIIVPSTPVDELREIAAELSQTSAVWVLIGTEQHHEKISFVATIAPSLVQHAQIASLAQELATLGMRGGINKSMIQGGAAQLPEQLAQTIETWLARVR